jgi:hypothetical protein
LQRAFRVRTLGDRKSILHQARLNKDWADKILAEAASTVPNPGVQLSILHRLVDFGTDAILDFDSARQLSWSLRVILGDLEATPLSPQLEETLAQLDSALLLFPPPSEPGSLDQTLDAHLRAVHEAEQRFDPKWFPSTLKAIKPLLPPTSQ